jgi:glycosyltransferase involved in cell wall biosynthesis
VSILFLSPTGQPGGAEAALHEMLAGLREAHPSWPLILVVGSHGPLVDRVRALGVCVDVLPFPPALARLGDWSAGGSVWSAIALLGRCAAAAGSSLGYLLQLRRLLRRHNPTLIHTNGLKMHLLGAWARPSGTSVVWHFHDFASRRRLTSRLLQLSARRCSAIVANSTSVAEDAKQVCRDALPIHPVWNAVDLTRFAPAGPHVDLDALARLPPADAGVVRVGLVSTYARWKGHATFLEALALLPASLPVRGYVIGGPVYDTTGSQVCVEELRDRAQSLGLGTRVGFTGFIADSSSAMRSLDIVVHASTEPEPFGLVIAEAMACAKPVVASRGGGAIELTDTGASSLTHEPGDVPGLADRIRELATDAALRDRLGATGRATAERCFTRTRMATELAPIYQALAHAH